ncbi:MAG: hypothetical protein M0Z51_01555 [Propionibacterium sp.]|nr:hypothetical protein [Propionibacterium sp.]
MSASPLLLIPLCGFTDLSCLAKAAAGSAFDSLVSALGAGVIAMVKFLSTFWLATPSPTVATGSGNSWTPVTVIGDMNLWLAPITGAIAAVSFAVQLTRVAFRTSIRDAGGLVRQLVAVSGAPVAFVAITQVLILAGDAFSPWIIRQASGSSQPSQGMETLITVGLAGGSPTSQQGMWFLVYLLCLLGALVQCVFMNLRAAALIVLMVFVGPTAAASASDEGWLRLRRLGLLILGFVLYKPVAAVIYAVGLSMMGPAGNDVRNALWGLTVMVMAALALPAFIKFLAPMAAMGSSSAASGAAAVGVVAAGAALVATGGWSAAGGGAAASGGAGGSAAVGGSAAGAGMAAPADGAGAASPGGGSSSVPAVAGMVQQGSSTAASGADDTAA